MSRRHEGLPRPEKKIIRKGDLLDTLTVIDRDELARTRVLQLEIAFRRRIESHLEALPLNDAKLRRFNTSPFVLLIHSFRNGYSRISQIENDILPAKLFSSMETSAGRMIEAVTLPIYGWECVASEMHSPNSALDGKRLEGDLLRLATLKSGPRCLNDEMSENFADAIIENATAWAAEAGVQRIDFSYGVLYGTQKLSNKKDWHILRNIREKLLASEVTRQPDGCWGCSFTRDGVDVDVSVRIGEDWWLHLGGPTCLVEMCVALIRACVEPGDADPHGHLYSIADLAEIVCADCVPGEYNVGLLQHSQLEWLFLTARHFCDEISDE